MSAGLESACLFNTIRTGDLQSIPWRREYKLIIDKRVLFQVRIPESPLWGFSAEAPTPNLNPHPATDKMEEGTSRKAWYTYMLLGYGARIIHVHNSAFMIDLSHRDGVLTDLWSDI